jgi:RimJ/RimL family protein N-acetyltransferase
VTTKAATDPEFRRFALADGPAMVAFLAADKWPFHGSVHEDPRSVLERLDTGYYEGPAARTFWILLDDMPVGMIRLFDLDDETPMFDLRISSAHRGRGLGTRALRWLTDYVFTQLPSASRIEGTTRQDNEAMRRAFRACGFAKEAHYRDGWPDESGRRHDAVGYAILRRDWAAGVVTLPDWNDEPDPSAQP